MNPFQTARLLAVLSLSTCAAGGCAGKAQPPGGVLTMRYTDLIDQPHFTTMAELKRHLSPISPKNSWAWDGGTYTIEHGPAHKLIVTASPQCQELVANSLIDFFTQDVQNNSERTAWLKLARFRAANQLPAEPPDQPLR